MREIFAIFAYIWHRRLLVVLGTITGTLLGLLYAFLATPLYVSTAAIVPRELKGSTGSQLSLQASVQAFSANPFLGNSVLGRLQMVLKGQELARTLIIKDTLLPVLYKDSWDAKRRKWKEEAPELYLATQKLRSMLDVEVDSKNMLLTLRMTSPDAVLSRDLLKRYLEVLNEKIIRDVIQEGNQNIRFLEEQMREASDPMVRDRIALMIARQVEARTLISVSAFEIISSPDVPYFRDRPKRKLIVVMSFLMGLSLSISGILAYKSALSLKGDFLAAFRKRR